MLYRFRRRAYSRQQARATSGGLVPAVRGALATALMELLALPVACVGLSLLLVVGCARNPQGSESGGLKKITFAVSPLLGSAAIYVAHERGYFKDEGLGVALQIHVSGQSSLRSVVDGQADLAAVAETPIAYAAVAGKPITVVATIAKIDRAALVVARRDRGISRASDLKGKSIGVAPGTTGDFFLHIYLTTSYINPSEVRIVNLSSRDVVRALLAGEVDAVSTWSPQTIALQDRLGGNAVVLDQPGLYAMTWNLVVMRNLARRDPDVIVRVLRAIIRANQFIAEQTDEARAVTARYLGSDVAAIEREWANSKPTAVLDQSLVLYLEDRARWILTREDLGMEIPNFLDYIDTKGLGSVLPDAVEIVQRQE